jgi:hypothetical protein
MSCPFSQAGGARKKTEYGEPVPAMNKELRNGAILGAFQNPKNPEKMLYKIIKGPTRYAQPYEIDKDRAQTAFDKYYSKMPTIRRGPRKGEAKFKSELGLKRARGYDLNHTKTGLNQVVTNSRYLRPNGPYALDYKGVDDGDLVRKPMSEKQLTNLARGREALKGYLASKGQGVARRPASYYGPTALSLGSRRLAKEPYPSEQLEDQEMDMSPITQQRGGYWW